MPAQTPSRSEPPRRRRAVLWLAIGTFLLFAISISQTAFNLKFIQPESNELGYAALSGLIFLLLLAITFVLLRNLLKLYGDRRLGVVGSKFRARMVLMVLLLSLLPVIAQFGFARLLLNRSIDKWFSRPVEEVRKDPGRTHTRKPSRSQHLQRYAVLLPRAISLLHVVSSIAMKQLCKEVS